MTVRFKCQSEYQKSYGASRSRSVSPQRCAPLAGLRSDQMGISREPGLQHRKRLSASGLTRSCTSLLSMSNPQHSLTEPTAPAHRKMPSAASRSRSVHRKNPSLDPKPSTPPESGSQTEPQTPAAPRPAADPEPPVVPQADVDPGDPVRPQATADSGPTADPVAARKSVKPHSSQPDSQSQPNRPLTAAPNGQQPLANQVDHALWWRSGFRGQRSGGHKSEYRRQFSRKNHMISASPILTAEQALYSSSRAVPPFKKNPVPMETEYQRSFQGLVPPSGPRFRKHVEHQRVPLFHKFRTNRKKKLDSQKKPHPAQDMLRRNGAGSPPPPAQVQRRHRMLTEYESSFRSPLYRIPEEGGARDGDAPQVKELREKALSYRRQAWGTNFSRDHLGQLQSDHNALWEPTDTPDSATDSPTPCLTTDLCQDPDSRSTSRVEALDLASCSSNSSKKSSVVRSGEIQHANKNPPNGTQIKALTPLSPERRKTWGEEEEDKEEEEENTDEEEGRLPTPRLKMRPVQRTHHDLTTPATGGAILVGKMRNSVETSPCKQQSCGSAVSIVGGADSTAGSPVKQREAWSDNNHLKPSGPSPDHKPASKPIRMKPSFPVAPSSVTSPPLHCIQGTLRHPDFQHNGELGVRFGGLQCSGGGCGSDEDDRLSVMSWRSAASCSVASAVLERAQKRRENFWGKR